MPTRGPTARYEVRATFQAPLEFVYRWCTDYTPTDARISGEGFDRRVVRRTRNAVVLEDLYDTGQGWIWLRRVVRLFPPARWRADSVGSDRAISVEYRLTEVSGNRTQLTIRARRRPYGIGTKNPGKVDVGTVGRRELGELRPSVGTGISADAPGPGNPRIASVGKRPEERDLPRERERLRAAGVEAAEIQTLPNVIRVFRDPRPGPERADVLRGPHRRPEGHGQADVAGGSSRSRQK